MKVCGVATWKLSIRFLVTGRQAGRLGDWVDGM